MRILADKTAGVTRGVVNESLKLEPELREVTFLDYQGVPHTVFTHVNGPFESAEDVANAWYQGTLHENPSEDQPAEPDEHEPQVDGN